MGLVSMRFSRRTVLLVSSLILSIGVDIYGETTADSVSKSANRSFVGLLGNDLSTLVHDRAFLSLYGAMIVTPHLLDEEPSSIDGWVRSQPADRFFEIGDGLGGGWFCAVIGGSALAFGSLFGSPRMTTFASDLARVQLLNGLTTGSLKYITNRERPDGAPYSFPSGHTSSAFATAAIVRRHFGKYWGGAATVAAAYVGLSRLQENKHYISDVVAGALVGTVIANRVAPALHTEGLDVLPTIDLGSGGGAGLSIVKRF
jgi:membrane-associated phospholipid phosphatase